MFIYNEFQKEWIEKIEGLQSFFFHNSNIETDFPYKNIKKLKEIGYTTITMPELYGGKEASLYDMVLFQEAIAKGDGATALSIGWHVGIIKELTENRKWDEVLFRQVCQEVKKGAIINRAASEQNTGSPTRGGLPETTATLIGNKWHISGRKIFTTLAPILDYFLVSATINGKDEIGDFLIPRDTKGVSIEETWDSVAMQATGSHDLVLDHVVIPANYMVENITQTKKVSPKTNGWLLHIPACYLGVATSAKEYAIHFANNYSPNSINAPISTLPTIKTLVGEIEILLYEAKCVLYTTARLYDESSHKSTLAPQLGAAKYIVTNNAIQIVDKSMRIVGLRGLSKKSPLHKYYLDVRAGLHNPPMDDATLYLMAESAINEVARIDKK